MGKGGSRWGHSEKWIRPDSPPAGSTRYRDGGLDDASYGGFSKRSRWGPESGGSFSGTPPPPPPNVPPPMANPGSTGILSQPPAPPPSMDGSSLHQQQIATQPPPPPPEDEASNIHSSSAGTPGHRRNAENKAFQEATLAYLQQRKSSYLNDQPGVLGMSVPSQSGSAGPQQSFQSSIESPRHSGSINRYTNQTHGHSSNAFSADNDTQQVSIPKAQTISEVSLAGHNTGALSSFDMQKNFLDSPVSSQDYARHQTSFPKSVEPLLSQDNIDARQLKDVHTDDVDMEQDLPRTVEVKVTQQEADQAVACHPPPPKLLGPFDVLDSKEKQARDKISRSVESVMLSLTQSEVQAVVTSELLKNDFDFQLDELAKLRQQAGLPT